MSAKYQIIISMCFLNTSKYFLRGNVTPVAFRSFISTGLACNEYSILCRCPEDPQNSADNCYLLVNAE